MRWPNARAGPLTWSPSVTRRTGGRTSSSCSTRSVASPASAKPCGSVSPRPRRSITRRLRGSSRDRSSPCMTSAAEPSTPRSSARPRTGSRCSASPRASSDWAASTSTRRSSLTCARRARRPSRSSTSTILRRPRLLARLRQDCVEAKEALSLDTETSIPVVLPGLRTEVRLTRGDLESMIRVPLIETVAALRRAMASAHVEPDDLTSVLLVGGSSRIPMVAELVTAELGRPVAVDSDPKHVVALGAARLGAMRRVAQPVPALVGAPAEASAADVPLHAPLLASPPPPPPPPSPVAARQPTASPEAEASEAEPRGRRRWVLIAAGAVAAVAAAIVAVVVLAGGGGNDGDAAAGGAPAAGQITTCPAAGQPAVCITGVQRDGNSLNVAFTTHDVTLVSNPARGDQLTATFFLSSTDSTASSGCRVAPMGRELPVPAAVLGGRARTARAQCVCSSETAPVRSRRARATALSCRRAERPQRASPRTTAPSRSRHR